MDILDDLKPCPFCGYVPEFIPHINSPDEGYLHCSCGVETEHMEKSVLLEIWNNRLEDN